MNDEDNSDDNSCENNNNICEGLDELYDKVVQNKDFLNHDKNNIVELCKNKRINSISYILKINL